MASVIGFFQRMWTVVYPPQPAKSANAIRIGLLGASTIGPIAVINPARSHPEVIVAAVAARDQAKAKKYAEKYGIPNVFGSYQELIDDPSIDAVYIPLPNGLHHTWALKCLEAGKHILLEKPSVSNSTQATSLFSSPLLKTPNPKTGVTPIILEAFHSLFHPAFQTFIGLVQRENIEHVTTMNSAPKWAFPMTDIRFLFDLAGGALMDCGTYNVMALRYIFGTEPEECVEASVRHLPPGADPVCEEAVTAKWRWKDGATGELDADLRRGVRWGGLFGWVPVIGNPIVRVREKEVVRELDGGREEVVRRTLEMWNFLLPFLWHRILVVEEHVVREVGTKKVVRRWTERETRKAYNWSEEGKKGEVWWTTYRCQLEEFVNRIRGREGSGVWMDGESSVNQMKMIDSVYERAGVPLRP